MVGFAGLCRAVARAREVETKKKSGGVGSMSVSGRPWLVRSGSILACTMIGREVLPLWSLVMNGLYE